MGDTLKLSLRLLTFALVAAVLLAATNEITKGPIREQAARQANLSRALALPGADEFEPMEMENADQYPALEAVHRVKKGGQEVGYTFLCDVQGYKGPIVLTLAVNASGSINALTINSQSETAGLGNKVADEPFLGQFPGLAADPDVVADRVDAISGATVSSKAVLSGVEQALRYAVAELGLSPKAGEVITQASVSAYQAIEARTNTENLRPLPPYAASGYPTIQSVYACQYQGKPGHLFEFEAGSVVLGEAGAVLAGTAHPDAVQEAQRYQVQFLTKAG